MRRWALALCILAACGPKAHRDGDGGADGDGPAPIDGAAGPGPDARLDGCTTASYRAEQRPAALLVVHTTDSRIELVGQACTAIKAASSVEVRIIVGCETVVL